LNAADRYQVPITLLDIKTPLALSALDYLEKIPRFKKLIDRGIITLPDSLSESYFGSIPAWGIEKTAQTSRNIAANFGLPGSQLIYSADIHNVSLSPYRLILSRQPAQENFEPGITQLTRWKGQRILDLPISGDLHQQVTEDGLTIEVRTVLFKLALTNGGAQNSNVLVLGGNLPHTVWGDPQAVSAAMRYIANHPWIRPLSGDDLLTIQPASARPSPSIAIGINKNDADQISSESPIHLELLNQIEQSPPNSITEQAWKSYLSLQAPSYPYIPELSNLRSNYLGGIGNLLVAAQWADNPTQQIDCSTDTDMDGKPECILASDKLFVIIDPEGGRLVVGFFISQNGPIQFIAPVSQFAIGLSDHSTWRLENGDLSDPAEIPGAFAGPWVPFAIEKVRNGLRFISPSFQKEFILGNHNLSVNYHTDNPHIILIPIGLSPDTRNYPDWSNRYKEALTERGWSWEIPGTIRVEVQSSEEFTTDTFKVTKDLINLPEDPNYEFPIGHFLPFPLALVTIHSQGNASTQLIISP
jgi:hypothetical protein